MGPRCESWAGWLVRGVPGMWDCSPTGPARACGSARSCPPRASSPTPKTPLRSKPTWHRRALPLWTKRQAALRPSRRSWAILPSKATNAFILDAFPRACGEDCGRECRLRCPHVSRAGLRRAADGDGSFGSKCPPDHASPVASGSHPRPRVMRLAGGHFVQFREAVVQRCLGGYTLVL